ncbi:hypothetical protein RB595_000418 [Gaeumannomyces hyphopodioides]
MSQPPSTPTTMAEATKRPASMLDADDSSSDSEHQPAKRHQATSNAATIVSSATTAGHDDSNGSSRPNGTEPCPQLQPQPQPQPQAWPRVPLPPQAGQAQHSTHPGDTCEILPEDRLRAMDSGELVGMIYKTHSALKVVSAQYQDVARQLNEIKACLSVFFSGGSTAFGNASLYMQRLPTLAPAPSLHLPQHHGMSQHHGLPGLPVMRPADQHSFDIPHAQPPRAPSFSTASATEVAAAAVAAAAAASSSAASPTPGPGTEWGTPPPLPAPAAAEPFRPINSPARTALKLDFPPELGGMPRVIAYSKLETVGEIWQEYKYGLDGVMAIEAIEKHWGSRWRPDAKGRTWFSRRKIIWDKIREYMHDGLDEEAAVAAVEAKRATRTIHYLLHLLSQERKDTKREWKKNAAEATAEKRAREKAPPASSHHSL